MTPQLFFSGFFQFLLVVGLLIVFKFLTASGRHKHGTDESDPTIPSPGNVMPHDDSSDGDK